MADWKGRGGGRPGSQPSLQNSNAFQGDTGAASSGWAGRGVGRHRSQPSVQNDSSAFSGDAGAATSGWAGRGVGRHRAQPNVQNDSRAHNGDPGAAQSGWSGRGGGRHRHQTSLQNDSRAHNGDPGAAPAGWAGRGGGRHRPQPNLSPASGYTTASGKIVAGSIPGNWIGRGKGRSPVQPVILPASLMAAQRAAMSAGMNALGSVAAMAGVPILARELEDPMGGYVFALEINGIELAHFQECSGLKSTTEVFEIKEGGTNNAVHKLPGQSTWDNIVLRYGLSSDSSMLTLRELVLNDDYAEGSDQKFTEAKIGKSSGNMIGNVAGAAMDALGFGGEKEQIEDKRFNGSIVIKNNRMQEMVRYTFQMAWVVSWEGPKFDATNSGLAIESIEIAHHGIDISRSWRAMIPMGWT